MQFSNGIQRVNTQSEDTPFDPTGPGASSQRAAVDEVLLSVLQEYASFE